MNPRIYRVAGYGLLALAVALIGYDRSPRSRTHLDDGAGHAVPQSPASVGLERRTRHLVAQREIDRKSIGSLLAAMLKQHQLADWSARFRAPKEDRELVEKVDARILALNADELIATILAISEAKPGDALFDAARNLPGTPSLYDEHQLRQIACCGLLEALARKDPGRAFALLDQVAGDLNALDPASASRVKGDPGFWLGLGGGRQVAQIVIGAAASDPDIAFSWYSEHRNDSFFESSQNIAMTGIMQEAVRRNISETLERLPQLDQAEQYSALKGIAEGLQTPGDRMDLIVELRRKEESADQNFAATLLQQTGFAAATADGAAEAWNWLDHANLTADERKAIDAGIELMTESCSLIDPKHPSPSNKDMDRFQRHQFLLHGQ